MIDDTGVGAGPIGRLALGKVVDRLYRAPFVADFDFVSLQAVPPLIIVEKPAII